MIKFASDLQSNKWNLFRNTYLSDQAKNKMVDDLVKSIPDSVVFDGFHVGIGCTPGQPVVDPYNIIFETRDVSILSGVNEIMRKIGISYDKVSFNKCIDRYMLDLDKMKLKESPFWHTYFIGVNLQGDKRVVKLYIGFTECDPFFEFVLNKYCKSTIDDLESKSGIYGLTQRYITFYFRDGKDVTAAVKIIIDEMGQNSSLITSRLNNDSMKSAYDKLEVDGIQLSSGRIGADELYFIINNPSDIESYINNKISYDKVIEIQNALYTPKPINTLDHGDGRIAYMGMDGKTINVYIVPHFLPLDTWKFKNDSIPESELKHVDDLIAKKKFEQAEKACISLRKKYGDMYGLSGKLAVIYSNSGLKKPEKAIIEFKKEMDVKEKPWRRRRTAKESSK